MNISPNFYGNLGDYYPSIGDAKSNVIMFIFTFWFFGPPRWENGHDHHPRAPNSRGPQDPTEKLAHWVDLLGQPLSRNNVFDIFRGESPCNDVFFIKLFLDLFKKIRFLHNYIFEFSTFYCFFPINSLKLTNLTNLYFGHSLHISAAVELGFVLI